MNVKHYSRTGIMIVADQGGKILPAKLLFFPAFCFQVEKKPQKCYFLCRRGRLAQLGERGVRKRAMLGMPKALIIREISTISASYA